MSKLFISDKGAIFLIIISIVFLILSKFNKVDKSLPVFNENSDIYEAYIIDFEDSYITTRNLDDSFKNEIEAIYPCFINKYNKILTKEWFNIDKTISFSKNIEVLEKKYEDFFKENAIDSEYINIELYGLRISKIRVLTNDISKYKIYSYEKMEF